MKLGTYVVQEMKFQFLFDSFLFLLHSDDEKFFVQYLHISFIITCDLNN